MRHYTQAALTASLMLVAMAGAAVAGPLEDGVAAEASGDYATALRLLGPLAEGGNAVAQDALGMMYREGEGVPQNYAEAAKWYRLAAEHSFVVGDDPWNRLIAGAQISLGEMYARGQGLPQNFAEAIKWWSKAADQGDAYAQDDLGVMYASGQGVPQDYAEAARWFRKAANQGNADAQLRLGTMYVLGEAVPQDYVLAHMWLNLAASQFGPSAKERHDSAVMARDFAARKMTPAQIAEAQKLAREWKPKPER